MDNDATLQSLLATLTKTEEEMKAFPMSATLRHQYLNARFAYEYYKTQLLYPTEGVPV